MSRSTFLKTNEIPTTTDLRFHHGRSNETLPIVVQTSTTKTTNKSITNSNPRIKRNLRDKRRPTGIRPNDVALASTSTEGSANEDGEDEENVSTHITEPNESLDHNRTITSSTPVFTFSRIQSSFENLSLSRTDPYKITSSSNIHQKIFRPEEFILRRIEKQTTDDDASTLKYRQLEERILTLESLVYDKDILIHDLQRKLDTIKQDLTNAEQQIYILHQDKLTLIKAFTTLQDNKSSSGDLSIRSNFVTRN